MAILINNARVSWDAYEFGVEIAGGHVMVYDTPENAREAAGRLKGKPVFRALYSTEWMDAKND